jgi:hypothetical protein
MADLDHRTDSTAGSAGARAADWSSEEPYWRATYVTRPYARADRGYEYYAPAYRYGSESARRTGNRAWSDVESDLRSGWDQYEHRGPIQAKWDDVKDAVRDAWDRVTGRDRDTSRTQY